MSTSNNDNDNNRLEALMEANRSPSAISIGSGSRRGSAFSSSSSSLRTSLSSADAATLRKHLAETKEEYQQAIHMLRKQTASNKAQEMELELLRNQQAAVGGGEENGVVALDDQYRQLIQDHAMALEQREAHAEQIKSLKEMVHELQQEVKTLRVQTERPQTSLQNLQDQVHKWEALYYESSEMAVSQLTRVEQQLVQTQESETKAQLEIQDLQQQMLENGELQYDFEQKMMAQIGSLEMQLEMAQTAETAATTTSNQYQSENKKLLTRIIELEKQLQQSTLSSTSTDELLETQKRLANLEAKHNESLEIAKVRIAELEEELGNSKLASESTTALVEQHEKAKENLQQQLDDTQRRLMALKNERNSAEMERDQAQDNLQTVQTELEQLKEHYQKMDQRYNTLMLMDENIQSKEHQSQLQAATCEVEELTTKLDSTEERLAWEKETTLRLQEQLSASQKETHELQKALEDLGQQQKQSAVGQEGQEALESTKEQRDQEIESLQEQVRQLEAKLETTIQENSSLRRVRESLHGFDQDISNVIESLETELPIAKAQHDDLQTKLIILAKQYRAQQQSSQEREDFLLEQLSEQTHKLQETETELLGIHMQQESKIDYLRQSLMDLKEDLEDANDTIYDLQEENDQLLRERKSWWKQMEHRNPDQRGAVKGFSFEVRSSNVFLPVRHSQD